MSSHVNTNVSFINGRRQLINSAADSLVEIDAALSLLHA